MKKNVTYKYIYCDINDIHRICTSGLFFEVFPRKAQPAILFTSMSLALVSVALVDIVFPLIDNAARFKEENSYKVKTIIKNCTVPCGSRILVANCKEYRIF